MSVELANHVAKLIEVDSNDKGISYEIVSADKHLDLTIDFASKTAYTFVHNLLGEARIPGAMTNAYTLARDLMQAESNLQNVEIAYILSSHNESVKAWVIEGRGRDIFTWDSVGEKNGQMLATKYFLPNTASIKPPQNI